VTSRKKYRFNYNSSLLQIGGIKGRWCTLSAIWERQ